MDLAEEGGRQRPFVAFKCLSCRNHDSFRVEFLVIPTALIALLINHDFSVMEILWTFSIYLESVAIMPQLYMLQTTGAAETITAHYLFALGSYRALYIFNWVYRFYTESFLDVIAVVAGIVQTVLYADFFYLYVTRGECPGGLFLTRGCSSTTEPEHPAASLNKPALLHPFLADRLQLILNYFECGPFPTWFLASYGGIKPEVL